MRIFYFASLRTRAGDAPADVDPPPEINTVGALIDWLRAHDPGHAAALADLAVVRIAVNQNYAKLDAPVSPGDEIAFFPPVTGGAR